MANNSMYLSRYTKQIYIDPALLSVIESVSDEYNDSVAYMFIYGRDSANSFRFDEMNFLSWEGDGNRISFLPFARIQRVLEDGGDPWTDKSRQTMRPGRAIRRIYKGALMDTALETFVDRLTAVSERRAAEIEIVSGKDIAFWYEGNRYDSSVSGNSLGKSCMRYPECHDYFDLYTDNPEYVKMAILTNPEKETLLGRALLWKTVERGWVMDRIYGSTQVVLQFKAWARNEGMWSKAYQTYDTQRVWQTPDGDEVEKTLNVDFGGRERLIYRKYPYLDTFDSLHLMQDGTGKLSSNGRTKKFESRRLSLKHTDGSPHIRTCEYPGCTTLTFNGATYCEPCRRSYLCTECGSTREPGGPGESHNLCNYCYGLRRCTSCGTVPYLLRHRHPETNDPVCEQCWRDAIDEIECYSCGGSLNRLPRTLRFWENGIPLDRMVCRSCYDNSACGWCGSWLNEQERQRRDELREEVALLEAESPRNYDRIYEVVRDLQQCSHCR